jgi:hypothetical protein
MAFLPLCTREQRHSTARHRAASAGNGENGQGYRNSPCRQDAARTVDLDLDEGTLPDRLARDPIRDTSMCPSSNCSLARDNELVVCVL